MKTILICLIGLFSFSSWALQVRVRIAKVPIPFRLQGEGIQIEGVNSTGLQPIAFVNLQNILISHLNLSDGSYWMVAKDKKVFKLPGHAMFVQSQSAEINGLKLSGTFLINKQDDFAEIIQSIDMEKYVAGVLKAEVPLSWPAEALKAQLVAIRSYTINKMFQRKNAAYHLDSTVEDQVFRRDTVVPEKIQKLINQTKDMVLVDRGVLIPAYYHADCGGEPDTAKNVWGVNSKDIHGRCPLKAGSKWQYFLSQNDLQKLRLTSVSQLKVLKRDETRRVIQVSFLGKTYSGDQFRRLLGFSNIKSTLFDFQPANGGILFSGFGFGHGVGLCQNGAKFLATQGKSMVEILKNYFPTASVVESSQIVLSQNI